MSFLVKWLRRVTSKHTQSMPLSGLSVFPYEHVRAVPSPSEQDISNHIISDIYFNFMGNILLANKARIRKRWDDISCPQAGC